MAGDYTVPNWSQAALANAAGLDMAAPVVTVDNDHLLVFMDLKSRVRHIVDKKDGGVTVEP